VASKTVQACWSKFKRSL